MRRRTRSPVAGVQIAALVGLQGKYDEANALYAVMLRIRENELCDYHPDGATSLDDVAEFWSAKVT